jgi:hypothetical protein
MGLMVIVMDRMHLVGACTAYPLEEYRVDHRVDHLHHVEDLDTSPVVNQIHQEIAYVDVEHIPLASVTSVVRHIRMVVVVDMQHNHVVLLLPSLRPS